MKIFLLTLYLAISCSSNTIGQAYYAVAKKLSAKDHAGLPFRFEASVKVMAEDSLTSARLFLKSNLSSGRNPSWNWMKEAARQNGWKEYRLEGIIDKDAENIVFGFFCVYPGSFYFDNLKLLVKTIDGNWKTINEDGFENGLRDWNDGFLDETEEGKNKHFQKAIDKSVSSSEKSCLRIDAFDLPGSNKKLGKYARVNGINLYYETYGTGRPLVILHGNGGSIGTAGEHLEFFAQRYKVIAIDSRGHGRSIDDTSELTYELMASDINALLDQLNIDSAFVWGHCDGAILAIVLALNHPKKVKKAVACGANVVTDTIGIEAPLFRIIENTAINSTDKKEKQLMTLMWKHPNIAPFKLRGIRADILIMSGDRDFIPLSHTLDIFKNIPNSNLCIIPGATHFAPWEKPKLFQAIVTEFFENPFRKPSSVESIKE